MYTKSELLEHFDKVDCVYFDFSAIEEQVPDSKGFTNLFFFIGPELVARLRIRNDNFRAFALYFFCCQRHLKFRHDSARVYRSNGNDVNFFFLRRLISMK